MYIVYNATFREKRINLTVVHMKLIQ